MTKLEAWKAWCESAGTPYLATEFTLEQSSHGKAFSFAWERGFVDGMQHQMQLSVKINKQPTKIFGPGLEELLNSAGFYRKREWVGLNHFDRTLLRTTYAPLKRLHHIKETNTDIVEEIINDWDAFFTAIEAKLKEKNT